MLESSRCPVNKIEERGAQTNNRSNLELGAPDASLMAIASQRSPEYSELKASI